MVYQDRRPKDFASLPHEYIIVDKKNPDPKKRVMGVNQKWTIEDAMLHSSSLGGKVCCSYNLKDTSLAVFDVDTDDYPFEQFCRDMNIGIKSTYWVKGNTKGYHVWVGFGKRYNKPSNKNIVIDENKAFTSGDFADLAGYAGPVLGAIAAVNPYLRGVKWLRGALDSRVGRALLVGAGSGIGKAAEESNEIARGIQMQNEEEVAKMVRDEAVLGTVAQGAAEVLGGIFKTYFGRTATNGNVRDSRFIMDGYDLGDVAKVDAQIEMEDDEE